MAKAATKVTKKTAVKSNRSMLDDTTTFIVIVASLCAGVALGRLDSYIVEHVANSNEAFAVGFLLLLTVAFAYAWFGGVMIVRSWLTVPAKKKR